MVIDIFIKSCSFIFVIIVSFLLKNFGILNRSDSLALSKVMTNITLPAAVITAFLNLDFDNIFIILVLFGLFCNLTLILIAYIYTKYKLDNIKVLYLISLPGYNIGCFTLSYIQNFFGPIGIIATCLFDAGNAIICTGGSYVLTLNITGKKYGIKKLIKLLFSSIPFNIYMLLLLTVIFKVHLPSKLSLITANIGNANSFIAMVIIGIMLELKISKELLYNILNILFFRYFICSLFSIYFYYFTSFPLEIRQVLSIIVFSPLSALAPLFISKFSKMFSSVSSFANSLSVMISIIIITILMSIMKFNY